MGRLTPVCSLPCHPRQAPSPWSDGNLCQWPVFPRPSVPTTPIPLPSPLLPFVCAKLLRTLLSLPRPPFPRAYMLLRLAVNEGTAAASLTDHTRGTIAT